MQSVTYDYEFNNGQVVASAPYSGMHDDALTASMAIEQLSASQTKITVTLSNTVSGEMYHIHAHDAKEPSTTPNGTPYNETPNENVFTQMATGNGGSVSVSQTIDMSYESLINNYDGFFVVHDPLQALSTMDVSTFLVVGKFARMQTATGLGKNEFTVAFNTGQVSSAFAYMGTHTNTLNGKIRIQSLADNRSRVSVWLMNSLNNEMYMVHSHDMAEPSTTPNGTPYDETPNADVCVMQIDGNGGTSMNSQLSSMSRTELTTTYEGFFVVHDPLQAISTIDPTTYVLLSVFARN